VIASCFARPPPRWEARACECYRIARAEELRLLAPVAAGDRPVAEKEALPMARRA
jgi:hypothetical protein